MQRTTHGVAAALFAWLALATGIVAAADSVEGTAGLAITIPLGEEGAGEPGLGMTGSAEGGWEADADPLETPTTIGDPELEAADRLPRVADPGSEDPEQPESGAPAGAAAATEDADAPQIVRRAVGDPPTSEGLVYLPPGVVSGAPGATPLPSTVLP